MGWCRYDWVYGASSMATDPSGYQVLLVSLIPTHLPLRRFINHTILSSLTTDVDWVSQKPRVSTVDERASHGYGVRAH